MIDVDVNVKNQSIGDHVKKVTHGNFVHVIVSMIKHMRLVSI